MQGVNDAGSHETGVVHVVYAWPYIEWGGAQRYFIALMRRMVGRARVSVVMPAGSAADLIVELQALGVNVETMRGRLPVTAALSFADRIAVHLRAWHAQYAMWRACRRLAAPGTVFHCDVLPMGFTSALWALTRRNGVVVTLHTALPRVGGLREYAWRLRLRLLTRRPGFRLVASNRNVRDSLKPFLPPDEFARVPLAYSPVERAEMIAAVAGTSRDETRRQLGIASDRFLVLTGAQFIERKGCWVLLEAARRVREQAADVDFIWLGTTPVSGRAETELRALDGVVRYMVAAEWPEPRRSYLKAVAAADVFVLPALVDGLPMALIEAMALGVTVVATPVNAIPEAIEHGVTGLLVPPGQVEGLVAAIIQLRNDRALAKRLSTAAQAHAHMFEAEVMTGVTLAVYESCARSAPVQGHPE